MHVPFFYPECSGRNLLNGGVLMHFIVFYCLVSGFG